VQLRDQLAKVFCFFSSEKKTFAYCRVSEVFAYLSAFEAEPLAFLGSVSLKVGWYKTLRGTRILVPRSALDAGGTPVRGRGRHAKAC
jgi:hypothetical protein